jgi:acyl-CoA reductase-like NAD-dependent aldehyde dehydrogenase
MDEDGQTYMDFPAPLNNLSEIQRMVLERYTETVSFAKNEVIFMSGQEVDGCYIIDEGLVRIESDQKNSDPDDQDDILAFLETGTFLGELSLLDRLPRSASAYAHTTVTTRKISTTAFETIVKEFPQIGVDLITALGRAASMKLRSTTERLDNLIGSRSDSVVEEMITNAETAQLELLSWSEVQIDALLRDLAYAVASQAEELARLAVEETGIGNIKDKTLKNQIASIGVYETLSGQTGYGEMEHDDLRHTIDIASPIGIIFGLVPVTNPTSTFIFKTLIALKARNAIILSPNRKTLKACNAVGAIIHDVLRQHRAPVDSVQWIAERNTRKRVVTFMSHKKVGLVLATGGPSVVKAAYSSGNPAIGVGSGNAPALICADADIDHAAHSVVMSKSFDNGLICGSEHNLVVVDAIYDAFVKALIQAGAAVLDEDEALHFSYHVINPQMNIFKEEFIGKDAHYIAEIAGIKRDYAIRLIIVPVRHVTTDSPFSAEKMIPILSLFRVADETAGFDVCQQLLRIDGTGHTAIIHTKDEAMAQRYGMSMPVSRILVNSPGAHGVVGMTTGLVPSLTLGCGTFGHTSTTDNVTYTHMMNVKRLAYYSPTRFEVVSGTIQG